MPPGGGCAGLTTRMLTCGRIVVNANASRFRKVRVGEVLTETVPDLVAAADGADRRRRPGRLMAALMQLPYGQRAAVVLRYWLDLSETETAADPRLLGRQRQEPGSARAGQAASQRGAPGRGTGMSIQDERELRERLGGLLCGIEPSSAPVAGTMRRGKGIRMRRWISAAAGLAVIAAGAVVLPGLLHSHPAGPVAPLHYKVTVQPPTTRSKGRTGRSGHH